MKTSALPIQKIEWWRGLERNKFIENFQDFLGWVLTRSPCGISGIIVNILTARCARNHRSIPPQKPQKPPCVQNLERVTPPPTSI